MISVKLEGGLNFKQYYKAPKENLFETAFRKPPSALETEVQFDLATSQNSNSADYKNAFDQAGQQSAYSGGTLMNSKVEKSAWTGLQKYSKSRSAKDYVAMLVNFYDNNQGIQTIDSDRKDDLIKIRRDIGLLKVSKASGKGTFMVNLKSDSDPVYALDDVTGMLYYRSTVKSPGFIDTGENHTSQISCYGF